MLPDHLGSTSILVDRAGTVQSQQYYLPYGDNRGGLFSTLTTKRFTGQYHEEALGLYFYGARWYDPLLGRFTQADTLIPDPAAPQAFNRYAYTLNNPLRYTDPSGHAYWGGDDYDDADEWVPPGGGGGNGGGGGGGGGGGSPIKPPHIVSRKQWGAWDPGIYSRCVFGVFCRYSGQNEGVFSQDNQGGYAYYSELLPGKSLPEILFEIVIHHEGNKATSDVFGIQQEHMWERGWTDIGYHFIIDSNGTIYEGRSINARGAHVARHNTGRIGILLIGDFQPGDELSIFGGHISLTVPPKFDTDYSAPTREQIQSATDLIRWLDYKYGIDSVVGHRDVPGNNTVCPGSIGETFIPYFNWIAQER